MEVQRLLLFCPNWRQKTRFFHFFHFFDPKFDRFFDFWGGERLFRWGLGVFFRFFCTYWQPNSFFLPRFLAQNRFPPKNAFFLAPETTGPPCFSFRPKNLRILTSFFPLFFEKTRKNAFFCPFNRTNSTFWRFFSFFTTKKVSIGACKNTKKHNRSSYGPPKLHLLRFHLEIHSNTTLSAFFSRKKTTISWFSTTGLEFKMVKKRGHFCEKVGGTIRESTFTSK